VVRVDIEAASRPEFGAALAAALDGFTFNPALRDGVPVFSRVRYAYEFRLKNVDSSDTGDAVDRERSRPSSIHGTADLDRPLSPISRPAPVYPTSLQGDGRTGDAVVEFLVNEDGVACVPRIVTATEPQFGYSAMQAASAWLFAPPSVGGSGATVRVRVPFKFRIPKPAS
jgi:TonB family protein